MKKSLSYRLYYQLRHGETFMIAMFFGLLLGKVIPTIWLIVPLFIVCAFGMTSSLLSRQYKRKKNI